MKHEHKDSSTIPQLDIESNINVVKVPERPEVINAENHNIMHPTHNRHHLERKKEPIKKLV